MKRVGSRRAFSLVEVLLALGIFGFSVLGLLGALDAILTSGREARTEQLVRSELANRLAVWEDGLLSETERVSEQESPALIIRESVRRESVAEGNHDTLEGFWRISITVDWVVGGVSHRDEASILRYQP